MKYDSFHNELMEFVEHESISQLVDQDAVGNIHTELEIKHFERVYQETMEVEVEDQAAELIELVSAEEAQVPQNFI